MQVALSLCLVEHTFIMLPHCLTWRDGRNKCYDQTGRKTDTWVNFFLDIFSYCLFLITSKPMKKYSVSEINFANISFLSWSTCHSMQTLLSWFFYSLVFYTVILYKCILNNELLYFLSSLFKIMWQYIVFHNSPLKPKNFFTILLQSLTHLCPMILLH